MTTFFASTRPGTEVTLLGKTYELPILYFRDDCFGLFFSADARKVRAALPSDRLHPVRLPGGRALVGVVAFNYLETTIGPYGEVAVVALAVHGPRPVVGSLPALLEASYPGFGMVVLHLPVTATVARDGGRGQWGYTKFNSDMRFEITPEFQQCRLSEGGQHILTLRVERGGIVRRDAKPIITYSVLDGRLIRRMETDRVAESIVVAAVQVARALDLQTIAEHVESESVRQKLVGLGVDYGQGYAIAPIEPLATVLEQIGRNASSVRRSTG